MDIKNIRYLFAIDELKSISAAAKRLYISQPTLSQFLKKYEDDLGYPIFIRTKQGLKLTREGTVFLDTAREILRLERDMRSRLADEAGTVSGSVIFAVSAQRAPFLMPQVLPEFYRKYPQVTVEIVEGRTKDLEEKLQKGTIDLGILVPPLSDSGICCEVFMDEEILLAVPKGMELPANVHREPGRIPWVDPAGLAECPFLLYDINNRLHDFAMELLSWEPADLPQPDADRPPGLSRTGDHLPAGDICRSLLPAGLLLHRGGGLLPPPGPGFSLRQIPLRRGSAVCGASEGNAAGGATGVPGERGTHAIGICLYFYTHNRIGKGLGNMVP